MTKILKNNVCSTPMDDEDLQETYVAHTDITNAIRLLRDDALVVIPTETVFGLAANAYSTRACNKIYELKNRDKSNPLIIHVASLSQASEICAFNDIATALAEKFWPGPLTIVLPLAKDAMVSSIATAGLNSVAVRIPDNTLTMNLLRSLDFPLAAPSANIACSISSTKYEHIYKYFRDSVPILSDIPYNNSNSYCNIGLESTIVSLINEPTILRHGFITQELLEDFLQCKFTNHTNHTKLLAPGMMKKHYSPDCNMRINVTSAHDDEVAIDFGHNLIGGVKSFNLSRQMNLYEAAVNLYDIMHIADNYVKEHMLRGIACAAVPQHSIGIAINDKLNRAIG